MPNGGAVAAFLRTAAGGFTREQLLTLPIASADSPTAITAADVDGGGIDLLVASGLTNSVTILRNTGTAGANRFGMPTHLATGGSFPTSVRAGDLNGDDRVDLVTTNFASDNVSVFFGQANGAFAAAQRFNAGKGPADARLIDIDGDGQRDIVFSTSDASNRFGILRNRGGGVFQAAETSGLAVLPDGSLAFSVALGQFNDDNADGVVSSLDRPDVAISNRRDPSQTSSVGGITLGLNAIVAGALNVALTAAQRTATGLDFGLRSVDAAPTINVLATGLRIAEDAAEQVISLSGLSAGSGQSSQLFRVSASASNPALLASLVVNHSASNATGDVRFTPAANANGAADITVTDAGADARFDREQCHPLFERQ